MDIGRQDNLLCRDLGVHLNSRRPILFARSAVPYPWRPISFAGQVHPDSRRPILSAGSDVPYSRRLISFAGSDVPYPCRLILFAFYAIPLCSHSSIGSFCLLCTIFRLLFGGAKNIPYFCREILLKKEDRGRPKTKSFLFWCTQS